MRAMVAPCSIARTQGACGKQRQHVGEHQFLMLLFVRAAQLQQGRNLQARGISAGEQFAQSLINISAIGEDFFSRRARQQAPFRPRMTRANRLVV